MAHGFDPASGTLSGTGVSPAGDRQLGPGDPERKREGFFQPPLPNRGLLANMLFGGLLGLLAGASQQNPLAAAGAGGLSPFQFGAQRRAQQRGEEREQERQQIEEQRVALEERRVADTEARTQLLRDRAPTELKALEAQILRDEVEKNVRLQELHRLPVKFQIEEMKANADVIRAYTDAGAKLVNADEKELLEARGGVTIGIIPNFDRMAEGAKPLFGGKHKDEGMLFAVVPQGKEITHLEANVSGIGRVSADGVDTLSTREAFKTALDNAKAAADDKRADAVRKGEAVNPMVDEIQHLLETNARTPAGRRAARNEFVKGLADPDSAIFRVFRRSGFKDTREAIALMDTLIIGDARVMDEGNLDLSDNKRTLEPTDQPGQQADAFVNSLAASPLWNLSGDVAAFKAQAQRSPKPNVQAISNFIVPDGRGGFVFDFGEAPLRDPQKIQEMVDILRELNITVVGPFQQ